MWLLSPRVQVSGPMLSRDNDTHVVWFTTTKKDERIIVVGSSHGKLLETCTFSGFSRIGRRNCDRSHTIRRSICCQCVSLVVKYTLIWSGNSCLFVFIFTWNRIQLRLFLSNFISISC